MTNKTEYAEKLRSIKENAKYLKLAYSYNNYKELLEEHNTLKTSIIDFYEELLKKETDIRYENGKQNRIRRANFPYKKYIEDLKREYLPEDAQNKLNTLETLEFIKNGQNVILAGNPGTGKTHIAIGLGYISFDKEGGELLFTHLSLRAERKSTIITTNLAFEKWEDIFKDPVMTAAIIDRVTHKATVINMNGNSYRLRETQAWIQENIKAKA